MKLFGILADRLRALLGAIRFSTTSMKSFARTSKCKPKRIRSREWSRKKLVVQQCRVSEIPAASEILLTRFEEAGSSKRFWQDLRYTTRILRKHPAFTIIAVLTLSLGIGANTAIFSIVNAVLLRPFPYESPEQLVIPGESNNGTRGNTSLSYPNFADWKDDRKVFASASAVRSNENYNISGAGEPERLIGRLVSAGFLSTLGIKPLLGRDFVAEDDRQGATPTVILSYGLWSRRFGNDPNIIGKQITLNNLSYSVVGVTPQTFQYGLDADVTIPIGLSAERFKGRGADPGVGAVARLKPGVSLEQAET